MRKVCFALCALALAACSEENNDYKPLTDYEKPYSAQSSAELKGVLQTNLEECRTMQEVFMEYMGQVQDPIDEAMEHYGVDAGIRVMSLNAAEPVVRTSVKSAFTGMKVVWNPQKQPAPGFDTTITAAAYKECLFPSSLTDDSKNDLRLVMDMEVAGNSQMAQTAVYKDGKLLIRSMRYQSETERRMTGEIPPYSMNYTMKLSQGFNRIVVSSITDMEYTVSKEGGALYSFNAKTVGPNVELKMDCNNVRLRASVNNIRGIMELADELSELGEERYRELMFDLLSRNISPAVMVFTDRDEKIGDITLSSLGENMTDMTWSCWFSDGDNYRFGMIYPGMLIK